MLPASVAKLLAIECGPLACFEQYTLRRASRLVRFVIADTEYLLGEDMIDALLKVGNLGRQTFSETAGDLAQKHAGLCTWVKEP